MTHISVLEWGSVPIGNGGLTRAQADHLLAAARAHPSGGYEGTSILVDHHRWLRSRQVVGVLAAEDCSLEILPKIDEFGAEEGAKKYIDGPAALRHRLVHMLDVALGLEIGIGNDAKMARQGETLLDILIRLFADKLVTEVRRGLPQNYIQCEEDLPKLRGRLDVARQFTALAVRPDRLACRFDALSVDTFLLQVMKACVLFLARYARRSETQRRLAELRLVLAEVQDVPRVLLPWDKVRFDRSNRHWGSLLALAKLFLRRQWQATHHDANRFGPEGATLLFPMNDLFESYVAVLLKRAVEPLGFEVTAQGGLRYCLEELDSDDLPRRALFRTRPDIIVRSGRQAVLILDTKWKHVVSDVVDAKRGVSESDVYQLMAYAQIYNCPRLLLVYPHHRELVGDSGVIARHRVRIDGCDERLTIASVELCAPKGEIVNALRDVVVSQLH
jgi:5-methylcytosine-specific restriction enzyme subunit McrC